MHGAAKRLRPEVHDGGDDVHRLRPDHVGDGHGLRRLKRIAAPMIGGIFTSFLLELVVYPAIYEIWKWHFEVKRDLATAPVDTVAGFDDRRHLNDAPWKTSAAALRGAGPGRRHGVGPR